MSCPRRNHHLLLFYCLFVLVHVQQTVNSLQNGYHRRPVDTHHRYGHNPLPPRYFEEGVKVENPRRGDHMINGASEEQQEHHYRHQHYRQLHHRQQPSASINSLGSDELQGSHSVSPSQKKLHLRSKSRRIVEAVHAFQASSTPRPASLHGHNPHNRYHPHHQPPQSHQTPYHPMHHQTPRPRPDNSLESRRKSLPWAVNRHRGSSVINGFATASPPITKAIPTTSHSVPSLTYPKGGSEGASPQRKHSHSKHLDATEDDDNDSYDDDYYDYEEDNGNDDDNEDDDDNGHANEYANAYGGMDAGFDAHGYAEPTKSAVEGFATNDENSSYALHENTMDYDDYSFLADEPIDELGSLTEQKWRNFSTREGVEKMAKAENPNIAAARHLELVKKEGLCKYPHPKVIRISNNTSKRFIPHFTVLHRCGDDTGCCWPDTKTCVVKTSVPVVLYFYVIPMEQTRSVIEALTLVNHTECHCIDRPQVRAINSASLSHVTPSPERSRHRCVKYFDLDESDPDYIRCDCIGRDAERREACQRLSRGEEGFMLQDQRCVYQGVCKPPTCEYGQYNRTIGRCPSKDYKIEAAGKVLGSLKSSTV
ncbi:uncharacterized protein LOC119661602 [Hermetia illucens]|nr:uncharacterized protein LOC119661602 [Hermetia illucens]XP_037926931.1 uncharacterized protein LOC119661602 [Hermetia illucens]